MSTASWKFVLAYGMITAAVAIASNSVVSVVAGIFPVPFAQFAPAGPIVVVGFLLGRLLPHAQDPEIKQRVQTIDLWLSFDMLPVFVYPVFTAVFMSLKPTQQIWLSLLLPVMKRLLRHGFWLMLRQDPDIAGAVTCSVGHLYHVLFTAMCLQNAKSLETLAAVVVVNGLHMLLNCRDILKDANKVQRAKDELRVSEIVVGDDIVSAALALAQQEPLPELLHRKSPSRMLSNFPEFQRTEFLKRHHEVLDRKRSLTKVGAPTVLNIAGLGRSLRQAFSKSAPRGTGQHILPTGSGSRAPSTRSIGDWTHEREVFVRSVTYTLHQTEITLLRSYITINVLILYGVFLLIVSCLPNRRYLATMSTMTTVSAVERMIRHLLLLGCMETVFLVLYLVLISRRLGVSGVLQLAFVLWSQRKLLQSKFLCLSVVILGFPLEHYGNSFIFNLRTG